MDANKERWQRVVKERALLPLLPQVIIATKGEALLKALQIGTVSTNVYLPRLHNFCVDMNWLPWPLVPKRHWPAVRFKDKRAITWDAASKIVARELNPERKAFYQLTWHLGASQSDLAHLQAEDVDWQARTICFVRMKPPWRGQQPPQIRFGIEVEEILATLPQAAQCPGGYRDTSRGMLVNVRAVSRESSEEFPTQCSRSGGSASGKNPPIVTLQSAPSPCSVRERNSGDLRLLFQPIQQAQQAVEYG